MTTGYAATLVSRTRGQASLLLPPTPSRFEPDAGPTDLHDDVTVSQSAEAAPGGSDDSPPLLGYRRPAPTDAALEDLAGPTGAAPEDLGGPAAEPTPPPAAGRRHDPPRRFATPSPDRADGTLWPNVHAPVHDSGSLQPRPQPADVAETPWTIAAARATPEPSGVVEQLVATGPVVATGGVVATGRVEHDDRSAARSAAMHDRGHDDPPIVVRIGRLDVRAVQASPAPPRPDPSPRRPTGPTLEARLLARDRR